MKPRLWKVAGALLGAVLCLVVCSRLVASDKVVVDYNNWLKDGEAMSWKLDPGRYKLEVTASGDGASVKWVGASCPGSGQTGTYSSICDLPQTGQVIVENPSGFGLGASVSVTVKITKLAE